MERMEYLLGATTDGEIAFAKFGKYDDGRFSCSFNTVCPHKVRDIDTYELANNYLDCLDKESLYDMCYDYECSPQSLADEVVDRFQLDDLMDCSLYPDTINIDGEDWIFESDGCGQHDLRGQMSSYVNKESFDFLMNMWDEYHLKSIPIELYDELIAKIDGAWVGEEEWISDYISTNFDK